jgi:hypothetical protein
LWWRFPRSDAGSLDDRDKGKSEQSFKGDILEIIIYRAIQQFRGGRNSGLIQKRLTLLPCVDMLKQILDKEINESPDEFKERLGALTKDQLIAEMLKKKVCHVFSHSIVLLIMLGIRDLEQWHRQRDLEKNYG